MAGEHRAAVNDAHLVRTSQKVEGGSAATELSHHVKRNQVVAEWTIDDRTLVIINREIG
jgi:hypothetical protein